MTDHTNRANHCDRDARAVKVDRMVQLLEEGKPMTVVCRMVGYHASIPYKWKKWARGENGQAPAEEYIHIVERLAAAQAKGATTRIEAIQRAAEDDDWRAAAWLLENITPWALDDPGDIEVGDAEEQSERDKQYSTPVALARIARQAVELGLVTIEELTGLAPQPKQLAAPAVEGSARPAADPLPWIMQTVIVALSAGDREQAELTTTICQRLRVSQEQVKQAYDRLGCEQQASPGTRTRIKLPERLRIPPRTTPAVEAPEPSPVREEEQPSPSANRRPAAGSWFEGPAHGTGDMIRESRGG